MLSGDSLSAGSRPAGPGILRVVEDDMCIACGACVNACPADVVTPVFHEGRGAFEVRVADLTACGNCPAPCDVVCPSIDADLLSLLGDRRPPGPLDRQGDITSMWIGFAPEFRDNGVSSSGGVLRAFIADSLRGGRPVICLAEAPDGYAAEGLRDAEAVERVPGSIYHSVSFDRAIALLRAAEEPCLLVSTPCQLEGITNYVRKIEPALEARIAARIGLICGWMYTHHALRAFARYKGIEGVVADARYRGEGEVGLLKITVDGEVHRFDRRRFTDRSDRLDYHASFSRYANRIRCRVCENHVNVLADVAVGDAWLGRAAGVKSSIVVVRTEKGEQELARLRANTELVLERALPGDLVESQSANLVYGIEARLLNAYLARRGVQTPSFVFALGESEPNVSVADRTRFRFELLMRRLLRSGRYVTFRRLYAGRDIARALARRVALLARRR